MPNGGPTERFLQWPLMGVAALLSMLILLTPGLLPSSATPAAGSLESTAVLVVDRVTGGPVGNETRFYLEGLAPVRYWHLHIRLDFRVKWPAPASARDLAWQTWTNATDSLVVNATTGANPIGVNVSALYVDAAGARVLYSGIYVFFASPSSVAVATLTPALVGAAPTTIPLPSPPQPLPLAVAPVPSTSTIGGSEGP
jgi:hypothetical protein